MTASFGVGRVSVRIAAGTVCSATVGLVRGRAVTETSSLRRNSWAGTACTLRPLARSITSGRGPSLITVWFTTFTLVMLTVLLMIVVLLTTTVL